MSSNWADEQNSDPVGAPGKRSNALITGPDEEAVASASIGTVHSITVEATAGTNDELYFESAGNNDVATFLNDSGLVGVDGFSGDGGSHLTIGGVLTNSGSLDIGNAALSASDVLTTTALDNVDPTGLFATINIVGAGANQARLDVRGAAGFGTLGVVTGIVNLVGNATIEFAWGQIKTIPTSATLELQGDGACIEDASAQGVNSALYGLSSVAGQLFLDDDASVAIKTSLSLAKSAVVTVDNGASLSTSGDLTNDGMIFEGAKKDFGGVNISIAGLFRNDGQFVIGASKPTASDIVTATKLVNGGAIDLLGGRAHQTLLNVTGGVAGFGSTGVLYGEASLTDSAIEFAAGQIRTIANSSSLTLGGRSAWIEDRSALGSNSALRGLSNIVGGLQRRSGASVSTAGPLVSHNLQIDFLDPQGGSSLTVGGGLTNLGTLDIGNDPMTKSDRVVAASIDNSAPNATINLTGGASAQARLDLTAGPAGFGAAGVLSGTVNLDYDAAIEFDFGEITAIATKGWLELDGSDAVIEDRAAQGANSALRGLRRVDSGFLLSAGAEVSTSGPLTASQSGGISLDADGSGGSRLTVGGALNNQGGMIVGNNDLTASDELAARSLLNSGRISLIGSAHGTAALAVAGAATNDGTISIASDFEEFAKAVGGTGVIELSNATLEFGSRVASGQAIRCAQTDEIILKSAATFEAAIAGFHSSDTIDARSFAFGDTHFSYAENASGAAGTLTLTDGARVAHILLRGSYTPASFHFGADTDGGSLISFV